MMMRMMRRMMMITKVGSKERQHGIEKKVKSAPVPVRDMVKYNQKRLDRDNIYIRGVWSSTIIKG